MSQLVIYSPAIIEANSNTREGERKLGEEVQVIKELAELAKSSAKYVLLGIPEDIGVRGNMGTGGTASLWPYALKNILNIQSNRFLSGKELLVLGHIEVEPLIGKPVAKLREAVAELDHLVASTIEAIVATGKIPIVIGGGHNNAYGNLKGSAMALKRPISIINVDAHADLRALEGRHSGNGFSYALKEGHIHNYYMLGLHENYASTHILDTIQQQAQLKASFFEDIFIREKLSFSDAQDEAIAFVKKDPCGLEIDLDCIQDVLASAITPSGLSTQQIRQLIHRTTQELDIVYLHLCEGAVELTDGRKNLSTSKLVAYLVADFIKAGKH